MRMSRWPPGKLDSPGRLLTTVLDSLLASAPDSCAGRWSLVHSRGGGVQPLSFGAYEQVACRGGGGSCIVAVPFSLARLWSLGRGHIDFPKVRVFFAVAVKLISLLSGRASVVTCSWPFLLGKAEPRAR